MVNLIEKKKKNSMQWKLEQDTQMIEASLYYVKQRGSNQQVQTEVYSNYWWLVVQLGTEECND